MIDLPNAWWHGCWLTPGHYLFDVHGNDRRRTMIACPIRSGEDDAFWLDASLAPRRLKPRAWLPHAHFEIPTDRIVYTRMGGDDRDLRHRIERESEECPQGEFLLHRIAGCTIAAWWDRTQGDSRGACNSCLIVEGGHDEIEMVALLPRLFQKQAARLITAGVALRFLRWA